MSDIKYKIKMKKRKMVESDDNKYSLIGFKPEDYNCCVCKYPIFKRVYYCSNEHWVCSLCYTGQLTKCPVCRLDYFDDITHLYLKRVWNYIYKSCKFCKKNIKVLDVETHEATCDQGPGVLCPSYYMDKCPFTGNIDQIIDHLKNLHNCNGSRKEDLVQVGKEFLFNLSQNKPYYFIWEIEKFGLCIFYYFYIEKSSKHLFGLRTIKKDMEKIHYQLKFDQHAVEGSMLFERPIAHIKNIKVESEIRIPDNVLKFLIGEKNQNKEDEFPVTIVVYHK